jgi:DNA-binding response OmpR family regulator
MIILNVDDDFDDRELFCDALKAIDPGITCFQANGGEKALDFLSTSGTIPDFIFIDINMPRMNGYECVKAIRLNKDLKSLQIVMYSTSFNPKDVDKFSDLGVRFLTKPNKFSELVTLIRNMITDRQGEK